ncbi:hypothetical protein SteCoe_19089 [Stentor coeruleus]|uniref:Uncharacterized protein n=1 Tax=Stentor coeruleus TaxID=5963 RepID=A0A1R2BVJ5_9CILI|nr:hypothetical protein SteCoe_19089 [Stentor coeruleus]
MSRYRPFLNLGGGIIAVILFGLTSLSFTSLIDLISAGRIKEKAIWDESAGQERKEMEAELEKYKLLWKKNRTQIMQKINEEYKEFKNQQKK